MKLFSKKCYNRLKHNTLRGWEPPTSRPARPEYPHSKFYFLNFFSFLFFIFFIFLWWTGQGDGLGC